MRNKRLITENQKRTLVIESIELNIILLEKMAGKLSNVSFGKRKKCSDRLDPNFLRLFSVRDPIFVNCFADAYRKLQANTNPGIFNKIGRYLSKAAVILGVKFTSRPESWYNVIWHMISFTNNTFFPGVSIICETLLLLSSVIGQFITSVCQDNPYDKINKRRKINNKAFMNNFLRQLRNEFNIDLLKYEQDLRNKNPNAYRELKGLDRLYVNTVVYLIVFMPVTSINLMNGKSIKDASESAEASFINKKLDDLDLNLANFRLKSLNDVSLIFSNTHGVHNASYESGIINAVTNAENDKYYTNSPDSVEQYAADLRVGFDGLKLLGII